jgi:twitching motility protein PilJ
MFNKTDITKSSDAQKEGSLISSVKVADPIVEIPKPTQETAENYRVSHAVPYVQRFGLVRKATILAIAFSTLPTLGIGAIAYYFTNKAITQQVTQGQTAATSSLETAALSLTDNVNRFMLGRYGDIQVLSNLPFLTNAKVSESTSLEQKQAVLDSMVAAYKAYSSVAVFDLDGRVILQSTGEPVGKDRNRNYFKEVLRRDAAIISEPETVKSTGVVNIYIAAPVKDAVTGKTVAVARAQMPTTSLAEVLKNYATNGNKYYLLDGSGKVFLSPEKQLLGKEAKFEFPNLANLLTAKQVDTFANVGKVNQKPQLMSYVPATKLAGLPDLNWQILLSTDSTIVFAPQRQLLWFIAIGTGLTAIIVGAIATWLTKRTIEPMLKANAALAKLNTSLEMRKEDENANINQLAENLQDLVKEQVEVKRARATIHTDLEQEGHQQLLELLNNVESAARGDLTVRADVTAGEIGIVADFFNSIVESLRGIVTQVKHTATQVNLAIGSNESAIRQLAEDALTQASEINRTLDAVDQMTNSIQAVAESAQQAAAIANHAAQTATNSGQAMDLTVQNILSLRETVGETTKKVRRLGESSQQISRVVSLINQIAMQTNLLAINAGMEAVRAGEEGQGFAVVAEEVGELAARSAAATQEIEEIVENIQRETSEVVQAMEVGTAQVVAGTQIVEDAKQSLSQILDVSRQIDSLVQSISTATASQVQTSQTVSQLMKDIAAVSQRTSDSSRQVSQSLQQTVEISQELQETVGTFKVN